MLGQVDLGKILAVGKDWKKPDDGEVICMGGGRQGFQSTDFEVKFLTQFATQSNLRTFAAFHLATRKLPVVSECFMCGTKRRKESSLIVYKHYARYINRNRHLMSSCGFKFFTE